MKTTLEYDQLLANNKDWVAQQNIIDPTFFSRLSKQQSPKFLWIGCSDSRVSSDKITGTEPGEIFVHRNIANLVVNTDINLLSVLQYSVQVLEVEHIIVCGHYGCGGIKAAMGNTYLGGSINLWLKQIKAVYRLHRNEIDEIDNEEARCDRLVELNVQEQVYNLAKTVIVQSAWKNHKRPQIHGWVYGLNDGVIKPIFAMDHNSEIDSIYKYDNL